MDDRENNLRLGIDNNNRRFNGCNYSQKHSKSNMFSRLSSLGTVDNNIPDEAYEAIDSLISGGIAPHQISGQLGYGSCKSGFINLTMHGNSAITINDC